MFNLHEKDRNRLLRTRKIFTVQYDKEPNHPWADRFLGDHSIHCSLRECQVGGAVPALGSTLGLALRQQLVLMLTRDIGTVSPLPSVISQSQVNQGRCSGLQGTEEPTNGGEKKRAFIIPQNNQVWKQEQFRH